MSVGTGFNSNLRSMEVQSDNKIIAGGMFTSYNGTAKNYIVRLNVDGTLDSGFTMGTGFNSYVFATALQADQKILVGGRFDNYNGTATKNLVRLNTDGTLDAGFTPPASLPEDIFDIWVQADGKVLIGGESYSSSTKNIARLNSNGTVDATFVKGTGVNAKVFSVASQSDGKVLVGGSFTTYNGTAAVRFARINVDGSFDTAFYANMGTSFGNNQVEAIAVQADSKIVVAGSFTTFNSTTQNRIIRLNTDGTKDTGFTIGTGFNNVVSSLQIQSDGRILAAGSFTSYNGTTSSSISYYTLRLNSDGTL